MKRIPALLLLVVLGAGGGASSAPAAKVVAPRIGLVEPRTNNPFPAQGLLVARGRDTVLIGLDGRPYARFLGARPPWLASADTARNAAFQQLAQMLPDRTLLVGPGGRWYLFDPPGRFHALVSPRVRLSGDIEIAARTLPTNDGVFQVDVTVERAGRKLVPAAAELRRISGNLAVGRSIAVDLQTGVRWNVSPDCYAAGSENRELLMFCGPNGPKGSVTLVSVSATGSRRTLARLPNSLYASSAYVSPDGKYVVGMFTPGCGPSYGFVVPTNGGDARPLSGEKTWSLDGPNTIALGWSTSNRVVAIVEPSRSIDREPKSGVYLIDPRTLTRTLVYPSPKAWAMWNPARG